jgi:hypothetical protein
LQLAAFSPAFTMKTKNWQNASFKWSTINKFRDLLSLSSFARENQCYVCYLGSEKRRPKDVRAARKSRQSASVSRQALRILSLQGNPAFSLAQLLIGKIALLMGSLVFCLDFFSHSVLLFRGFS